MAGTSTSGSCAKTALMLSGETIEQRAAGDHAVLDDFVQAGSELAPRQRLQQLRIDHDDRRLVKRADQVLAERVVDADLAADRAVHLREQRRRHVGERDAAQEGGGREPGRVADHAAADGDDRAAAIGAGADQRLVDARDRLQVLEALAVGQQDRLDAAERFLQPRAVQAPDDRARDDESPRADAVRVEQFRQPVADAVADPDRRWARRPP